MKFSNIHLIFALLLTLTSCYLLANPVNDTGGQSGNDFSITLQEYTPFKTHFKELTKKSHAVNFKILEIEVTPNGSILKYQIKIPLKGYITTNISAAEYLNISLQFLNFYEYQGESNISAEKHHKNIYLVENNSDTIIFQGQSLLKSIPTKGRLSIFLNVSTEDNKTSLLNGVYDLGPSYRIAESTEAQLIADQILLNKIPSVKFNKANFSENIYFTGEKKVSARRNLNEYYIDKKDVSFKFKGIDLSRESTQTSGVRIGVTACLKDPVLLKPAGVRFLKLNVYDYLENADKVINGEFAKSKSVENDINEPTSPLTGCFSFADVIEYNWYKQMQGYIMPFKITDKETNVKSYLATIVNPWNTGWIFAQDIRTVTRDEVKNDTNYKPSFFISQISLNAKGVHYEIDNQLKMHLKKKYIASLHVTANRLDSISRGSFDTPPIKGGYYLLNLAIARKDNGHEIQVDDFINSWQQVVKSVNGRINTEIEFSIADMTLMGTRNHIIVQVMPIEDSQLVFNRNQEHLPFLQRSVNQQASLKKENLVLKNANINAATFAGPFIPLRLNSSSILEEITYLDAFEYIAESKSSIERIKNSYKPSVDMFDTHFRLKPIMLSDEDDLNWLQQTGRITDEDVEYMLPYLISNPNYEPDYERRLQYKLCHLWSDVFLPEQIHKFSEKYKHSDSPYKTIDKNKLHIALRKFKKTCLRNTRHSNRFFSIDKKVIVKELDTKKQSYMGGVSFNFGVGSSFHLNKGKYSDIRKAESNSFSFSAGVKETVVPFVDIGLSVQETLSSTESLGYGMSTGSSLNYNFGAFLVIQNSNVRLTLNKYQQCIVVTPSADATISMLSSAITDLVDLNDAVSEYEVDNTMSDLYKTPSYQEMVKKQKLSDLLSEQDILDVFESGIRVCADPVENFPIQVSESFYYVTQHFLAGDMHDPADKKNRPWLMSIRSHRDFKVFIQSVRNHNKLKDVGDLNKIPIDTLMNSYSDYNAALPSWPGIITLEKVYTVPPEKCQINSDFAQRAYNSLTDFFKGPFTWKDGTSALYKGFNFWEAYFCPHTESNYNQ